MPIDLSESDWLIPTAVTAHQLNKLQDHARERLDLAVKYLHRRNISVQAGGSLGIWPFLLVKEYQFQQVYSFEPEPDNFVCLVHNTRTLPVHCFEAALGRTPGTTGWLKDRQGRPGWHKVAPAMTSVRDRVRVMTVDDTLLGDGHLGPVDLLALDVEGFELEALMGAEQVLAHDRPVVIVEDLYRSRFRSFRRLSGMAYGHPLGELQRWLRERGYRKAEAVHNDEIWVHGQEAQ